MMHIEFAILKLTALYLDQDDFLPRTATPLEDIFKSLFWYVLRTTINVAFLITISLQVWRIFQRAKIYVACLIPILPPLKVSR